MNILFLTLSRITYIKERGIYTDLMREFVRRGHIPYIVCPTERRFGRPESLIESDGAKILHVKTLNIQKTNVIEKGIGTLMLEYQYIKAIKKYWNDIKFDLCIYSTPPITFNKVIEWQKNKSVRTYLLLKDIFPQNAVDLGMFSNKSILYKMFRKKERKLYALSDKIGCMSPANSEFVIKHNPDIDKSKVEICPNSIEVLPESIKKKDKSILIKYGMPTDKPLFIYGGNLGKPQGIDFLIRLLDELKNNVEFHFCIVGSGTESNKLNYWYINNNPKSVTIMDALPKEDYDMLVSAADVGMIFLDNRFTIPNFPSRLLSYLENSQPVLLATDKNTDMGRIAESNGFGLWSESGDLEATIANIKKLASNAELRKIMGEKGYKFLLENYTVDKSVDIILRSIG